MFISTAFAQTAATQATTTAASASGLDGTRLIIQLLVVFVIFYFLLIRPQQKRMREHQAMLSQLTAGANVVVGGIMGEVSKVLNEQEVLVKIADGVEVKVLKSFVSYTTSEEGVADTKNEKKKK